MEILALIIGFIAGLLLSWRFFDHAVMVVLHIPYINRKKYMDLYDSFASEAHYLLIHDHAGIADGYTEYTEQHTNAKSGAYADFTKIMREISLLAVAVSLVVVVLLSLVFNEQLLFFGVGLIIAIIFYGAYSVIAVKRGLLFYRAMLVLPSIISGD